MTSLPVKRVAVIGAGPAGAITLNVLAEEKAFDVIRVFERREDIGGCWIQDKFPPPTLQDFPALSSRSADTPPEIPSSIPAHYPKLNKPRFSESSVYPTLETNIGYLPMQFSREPIPAIKSAQSISLHGENTPFRKWDVIQSYIKSIAQKDNYDDFIEYNTTVERVEKVGAEWKLTLRKDGKERDYWWVEWFDAVIVASGHYYVPYVPNIQGLEDFEKSFPGSVLHSKHFRGPGSYRDKTVVVVGASVSAADISHLLAMQIPSNSTTAPNIHAITIGHTAHPYFGTLAFEHPRITNHPSIARVDPQSRTVHLVDGSEIPAVDHIIFGTGYSWTLPFLPGVDVSNNRVPGLYQHVVWRNDPTLLFVGAVAAGLTFKVFEWQAVLAARILAGRTSLPSLHEMKKWEDERVRAKGDGVKFTIIYPEFEDYFETLRELAGEGVEGVGRKLPKFCREWSRAFHQGHGLRRNMWIRLNAEARRQCGALGETVAKARL